MKLMPRRRAVVMYGLTVPVTASNFLRGQLGWIARRGWEIHVTTSPGPLLHQLCEQEGCTAHEIPMSREISLAKDLCALAKWIALLLRIRPRVVNMSSPKASFIGLVAAWITRVPTRVYLVRGLRFETEHGLRRRLLIAMEWSATRLATTTLVVSDSVAQSLQENKIRLRKHTIMLGGGSSNGVRAHEIAEAVASVDRHATRTLLKVPQDTLVIGYIGRLTSEKGLNELADALMMPELRDAYLVTQGDVEQPEVISRLGRLNERWIARPFSPDISETLAVLDIFCLPTYREGLPNVILEASASSLPVVSTDVTGARDAVVDDVTGILVPSHNSSALGKALAELASDPTRRWEMGNAGQEWVRSNFNPEQIWDGLAEIYEANGRP